MKVNIAPHPTNAGWYYLDYRPDGAKGKRVREAVKGWDLACAKRDELEVSRLRPTPIVVHPTIKDVYREYLAWVERSQAPATYRNKVYAFEHRIIPHFGSYRIRDLTVRIYDDFQAKFKAHRRATVLYQDYLGGLIKWMVKRKMAEPLTFTPEKPKYHPPRHSIYGVTELDLFIAAIGSEDKRMILTTILWTGLRWNEVVNLRWEDVNVRRGEIIVKESKQEAQAVIRIAPDMAAWFKAHHQRSGWVFENPKTKEPWGSLKTIMINATKKTGVDITPHDIRRISAMMVYEATGGDILAVQHHLRHKDIKTTVRYLECSGVRMHQAHDGMVAYIEGKRKGVAG